MNTPLNLQIIISGVRRHLRDVNRIRQSGRAATCERIFTPFAVTLPLLTVSVPLMV